MQKYLMEEEKTKWTDEGSSAADSSIMIAIYFLRSTLRYCMTVECSSHKGRR